MELKHSYIANLVAKTQKGDNEAFAQLYSMTYNKVFNYARNYLKDDYLAQDAVQEIYILALKNIGHLKDQTLFVAWLNQISFRVCYDMTKSLHRDTTDTNSELLEEVAETNGTYSPEESAFTKDEKERLSAAIDKLDPTQKQLIVLRFYNNNKIDDIVTLTDLSRSTVKRQLASAIEKLKVLMNE